SIDSLGTVPRYDSADVTVSGVLSGMSALPPSAVAGVDRPTRFHLGSSTPDNLSAPVKTVKRALVPGRGAMQSSPLLTSSCRSRRTWRTLRRVSRARVLSDG